ncbi:MAG: glycosyltransferase family 2 protein [Acidobacteriota bacterium]|nr:glycosyltransferase family 2 protein [Acidobacteriota bacterium]
MKFSVVMTVYNRPQLMLMNTLVKLGCNDWTDGEIVIVDDGSNIPYQPIIESFGNLPVRWIQCNTFKDHPHVYQIDDGYNNPAHAANMGLEEAKGEHIFWMSSDVMVPPNIIDRAFDLDLTKVAYMPCVVDLDTNQTYLGPDRLAPLGWFYGVHRSHMDAVKWDLEYLKGIAFEDNDFMCRLGLQVGRFVIDKSQVAWHQSHPQTAYSDDLKGWKTNQEYTMQKHDGVPFHTGCPLKKSLTDVNHQLILDMEYEAKRIIV